MFKYLFLLAVVITSSPKRETAAVNPRPVVTDTGFTNPLLPSGPDPWVIQSDSSYYFTCTTGNSLVLYKTGKMSDLKNAVSKTIWTPSSTGPCSKDIWAPELHHLQNKWYLYFAADDGNNNTHRIYVLENASSDPVSDNWVLKGKVADSSNHWAIDATVFEYNDQLYMLWSGWQGNTNGEQDLYIAKMSDPCTISGGRVMISSPTYDWEKMGAPPTVNEGPEMLENKTGNLFITYSASGCWTDHYCLGLLTLKPGGDPMNISDWTKASSPVFTSLPSAGAFAPGHNSFFKSRDGTEDWLLYHANNSPGLGCGRSRSPRMQKFTWNADGSPDFGTAVNIHTIIKKPSGE